MHHIYHTNAFVLGARNRGEADKIVTLYTRELGLVRAVAQGIRLQKSKSRFALQDFSLAEVDLVQGRDIWRITSTKSITTFPFIRRDKKSLTLIFRISKLITRLCTGEESSPEIFDGLMQVFYLLDNENLNEKNREAMELYLVFKIVYELGYVGQSEYFDKFMGKDFEVKHVEDLLKDRKSIIAHINKAIRESHL